MTRSIAITLITLVVWVASTLSIEAARRNDNSLDWDPKKVVSDSLQFGGIIPDGDVYIASVDSAELKQMGYHVTNDLKDAMYYGELRLPAGHHTLVVYSIKPQQKRNIAVERGDAYVVGRSASGRAAANYGAADGSKSGSQVITKGGSGSKMLVLEIDVSAGEQYIIKAGKATEDWTVTKRSTGKNIEVKLAPLFSSEE